MTYCYSDNELIDIANKIETNIVEAGFLRYDCTDIRSLPWISKRNVFNKIIRSGILLLDELSPLGLRFILGIDKTYFTTAYTHVAHAYLIAEKNSLQFAGHKSAKDICLEGLNKFCKIEGDDVWWDSYANKNFYPCQSNASTRPTLALHGLARYNILLLEIGKHYNDKHLIDVGFRSASTTLKQHQITHHNNGALSINYYYNSDDCTLNVNSEFAHWLSSIPEHMLTDSMASMLTGLVQLLIHEQNDDGSWFYYSKSHMLRYNIKGSIDCNHTGTVLYNIMNIIKTNKLSGDIHDKLVLSLNKGVSHFIDNLFDNNKGVAINIIGYSRPAGPVQYAEAIFALCEFIDSEYADRQLRDKVIDLLPKYVHNIVKFVDEDGSAPGEKVIRWVNINSIRWGNGPILQAIMSYLAVRKQYNFNSL